MLLVPGIFQAAYTPGSLTWHSPWKITIPKGKDRLPFPSFFRGELLYFGGVESSPGVVFVCVFFWLVLHIFLLDTWSIPNTRCMICLPFTYTRAYFLIVKCRSIYHTPGSPRPNKEWSFSRWFILKDSLPLVPMGKVWSLDSLGFGFSSPELGVFSSRKMPTNGAMKTKGPVLWLFRFFFFGDEKLALFFMAWLIFFINRKWWG